MSAEALLTSPRLRGEVEIRGSEFRVRGNLRESQCGSSPSPQPSPRKSGAREKKPSIPAAAVLALESADMLLGVKFEPDALDQVKLGLEEVDMMLLVLHQAFEQIA